MKQSERMAVLLFLHTRMEISDKEEMELTKWRKKSPENEKLFQEINDPEQVRQMMAEYYRERDRSFEKLKAECPSLAGANLYRANEGEDVERMMDFPEKDIAESGLSKAEFWTALLTNREVLAAKKKPGIRKVKETNEIKQPKRRKARRYVINFLKAAAVVVLTLLIYPFVFHTASDRFQAVMIFPDGSSSASDEYHEGLLDGRAGIKFDKTANGEPVLVFPDHPKKAKEDSFTLMTLTGNEKILRLPDKTMLWMSAETTVNLPALFSQDSIQIKTFGEVWIETAPNSKRHIIVSTVTDHAPVIGHRSSASANASADKSVIELQVLSPGAKFNFTAYPNDTIRATLMEGTANVQFTGVSGKQSIPLQVGQQFKFRNGKYSVDTANRLEAMAIKNGEIYIPQTDVPTILAKLKRWYKFDIIYEDHGIPNGRYSLQTPIGTNLIEVGHRLQRQGALVYSLGNKMVVFSH